MRTNILDGNMCSVVGVCVCVCVCDRKQINTFILRCVIDILSSMCDKVDW